MLFINIRTFFQIIIPSLFLLTNCASNKVVQKPKPVIVQEEKKSVIETKSCSEKSRVTVAKETFIQFRHDISEVNEYKKVAADWCNQFLKIPVKGKLKCGTCCDASFFCKWWFYFKTKYLF